MQLCSSLSVLGFPGGSVVKNAPAGGMGLIPASRSPGEGNATHSNILAWRIPGTEEPGGLQSIGLQRVGRDGATNTHFLSVYVAK